MCGIAGFVGPGDRTDLEAMTSAVTTRGPDGEGFHVDAASRLFLGHRRLAVIDIAHGAQPIWDAERSVAVVFNGEIYNHLELRAELEALGHVFLTDHCDTEVLVHGWKAWGRDLPLRLNGMFAFAIWQPEGKRLFLARDRFGEKPLFWAKQGDLFLFGSELTAIDAHRGFVAETDNLSLAKLFAYGFIPAPRSFYRSCSKLPAGHWLEYRLDEGSIETQAYWSYRVEPDLSIVEGEAEEELRHLLRTSVSRRLMTDVPLGVFLSGGVDSTTVATLAAQSGAIDTFCIGFNDKSYDESAFAQEVAHHIGSRHHLRTLDMAEAIQLIPDILGRLDEPIADPSILPTYLLCRFAREHVTVALSGDGGDELLAGYDTFAALKFATLYQRLVPSFLHGGVRRMVDLLPKSSKNMSLDFKLRRSLAGVGSPPAQWNPRWLAPLQPEEFEDFLQMQVDPEEVYEEAISAWNSAPSTNLIDRTSEFYTRFYLQDNILTKVDRAAMMNSLETRAVFLDTELVDFIRRLPADFKFRNGVRKRILKRAVGNIVPESVLGRAKKGFGIPLMDWIKKMPAAQVSQAVPQANFDFVLSSEAAHRSGRADHRSFLWTWKTVQWHRQAASAGLPAGWE